MTRLMSWASRLVGVGMLAVILSLVVMVLYLWLRLLAVLAQIGVGMLQESPTLSMIGGGLVLSFTLLLLGAGLYVLLWCVLVARQALDDVRDDIARQKSDEAL